MPTTTYSQEEITAMMSELQSNLLPALLEQMQLVSQLPPLLTRQQFMELADISHTKANELFNTRGFPVTRKLGYPRVLTKEFFEWLNEDVVRREEFPNFANRVI
ncbi:hypothetical protein [Paraliobacillus ryukyuensis]|uniref:hypothetical protein n=1 Tax=Paraliobacillus ryukyuensis TaxID=200904 RepID=UPI0009A5FD55|nr:hypothetical protein [Paraliobacillus ryukyuensis]